MVGLKKRFVQALRCEGPNGKQVPSPTWLYAKQRGVCFHCGKWMDPKAHPNHPNGWSREHVLPRSRGGGSPGNVVLAHYHCNAERADALPSAADIFRLRLLYQGFHLDIAALVNPPHQQGTNER